MRSTSRLWQQWRYRSRSGRSGRPFQRAENILPDILPEFAGLADVLKVIDVPRVMGGQVLRVLLNADLEEAVGLFSPPQASALEVAEEGAKSESTHDQHWRWRLRFAERIAASLDAARFGVQAIYVIGSTKNATAGPASDIDLLVHCTGTEEQRRDLATWLEGWSLCLSELNFLRTGHKTDGLLDVHYITDADILLKTSFAARIGAATDAARPLKLGGREG